MELVHNTYLHAGYGTKGWPHDHKAEDTYEAPPYVWTPPSPTPIITTTEPEYVAEFGTDGSARLYLSQSQRRFIAKFDTMADAQKAAKALNEAEGL